jgi:dipeptidase D
MAIHAGLECGIIGKQKPEMEMIAIGPTIKFPHSPKEKVEIASVEKFWKLILQLIK